MPDRMKPGVSVATNFVDGEQPTAAKINTLGLQLQNTSRLLETAIGDYRGQSWPYHVSVLTTLSQAWGKARDTGVVVATADERYLDIANLARLIGPASNLNPLMSDSAVLEEITPTGLNEFCLRYPIYGTVDGTNPTFSDASLTTFQNNPDEIATAGDYSVLADGRVYCFTPTAGGGTAIYETHPATYGGGLNYTGARHNVIPDPNQISGGGADVTVGTLGLVTAGRHRCTLPTISHQQIDITGQQSATTAEVDVNHGLQYRLPVVLDGWVSGDAIPEGFMYLKNNTTGKIYTTATYYWISNTTFEISGVDLTAEILSDTFSVITVGADITTAINDLQQKHFHTHDRSFGEPLISINSIADILAQAGNSGPWCPSEIPGNFAPQYLHRDGMWDVDDPTYYDMNNLNDANTMRGHFVLGYYNQPASEGLDTSVPRNTNKVIFGNPLVPAERGYIYKTSGNNMEYVAPTSGKHLFNLAVQGDYGFRGNKTYTGVTGLSLPTQQTVAPYALTATIQVETGVSTAVTLTDLPVANYTIDHIDVLVARDNPATIYHPPFEANTNTYEYYYTLDVSGVSPILTLQFAGASWPSPAGQRLIRLIVWYHRI